MIRRFFKLCILLTVVVSIVFVVNLYLFISLPGSEEAQSLVIDRGESLHQVLYKLSEKKIISNPPLFKFYILMKGAGQKIRAGEYEFPAKANPKAVLELLLKGDFAKMRITIPEGWTVKEIANHLGQQGLVNPERFIARCSDPTLIQELGLPGSSPEGPVPSLEGYLFPDTYEIYKPKDEVDVIQKMVSRFKEKYGDELRKRTQEIGWTQQQVVTLASIVEKETGQKAERPLIASVFFNRLKRGMPLASDPTVIYGIPNFSGNLTRAHLIAPGPYNTYLNTGLPPTPIANPGIESIRAVLYPAQTDYLFFVSKNDGTHQFSRTEAEHFAAVRQYQIEPFSETEPKSSKP